MNTTVENVTAVNRSGEQVQSELQHASKAKLWLLLASSLTIMASATLAPALPAMSEFFKHHDQAEFWVKMVIAMPGLLIAITAPIVGLMADRSAKKVILLAALLLYAVAGLGSWLSYESLPALLVWRALLGIAVAGVMVSVTTIAAELFRGPALGHYMGLQAAFGSFGGVLFLALGGFLADGHWRNPMLLYVLALLLIPPIVLRLKSQSDNPEPTVATDLPSIAGLSMGLYCFLAFVEVLMLYLIPLQYPFLASKLGVGGSIEIGITLASVFLLLALVAMYYHRFQNRLSYSMLHTVGYVIVGLGFIIAGFSNHYVVAIVGMLLSALGFGLIRPNLLMWLFSVTPVQQRGKIMGIITSFYFLAQFFSPVVFQILSQYVGMSATFTFSGGICLLLSLSFLIKRWPWKAAGRNMLSQ